MAFYTSWTWDWTALLMTGMNSSRYEYALGANTWYRSRCLAAATGKGRKLIKQYNEEEITHTTESQKQKQTQGEIRLVQTKNHSRKDSLKSKWHHDSTFLCVWCMCPSCFYLYSEASYLWMFFTFEPNFRWCLISKNTLWYSKWTSDQEIFLFQDHFCWSFWMVLREVLHCIITYSSLCLPSLPYTHPWVHAVVATPQIPWAGTLERQFSTADHGLVGEAGTVTGAAWPLLCWSALRRCNIDSFQYFTVYLYCHVSSKICMHMEWGMVLRALVLIHTFTITD